MKTLKLKILPIVLIAVMISVVLAFSVWGLTTDFSEPQLNIVGTNLSFSESVYIKYAVSFYDVDSEDDVKLLIWRNPQSDYTLGTETVVLTSSGTAEVSGRECVIFDYTQLAAKEMTDTVYARAVYQKNGKTYYSDVKKYSVLTYVYNKLGYTGTATSNENLAALLEGLIEYGASAQDYFNYKTDDLATDKHVRVTLTNGYFEDGCSTSLVLPGTKLKVTAPITAETGEFLYWQDEEGNIISTSETYEITAGDVNSSIIAVYDSYKGGNIEGAGTTLASDSFAMTSHIINTDEVNDISSSDLVSLIQSGLEAGKVYRVNDGNPLTLTSGFDGNGAAIIVPAGINFDSLKDTTVSNAIIFASVTVSNSSSVLFSQIDVQSEFDSVSLADSCTDITFDNCRIASEAAGLISYSENTTIKNSYVKAYDGVVLNESSSTVYNSHIVANNIAVYSAASDNAINNNTILCTPYGTGITIDSGSLNSLLSYNIVTGAKDSICVEGATNTVLLFNSFHNTIAENNVNLYIVENSIGGALELNENNYLLCDANTYDDNDKDHTLVSSNNKNTNGDTLMDVTARNEVGAKEELLPHTNKDLFLNMERKTTVKDIANGTSYDLNTYVEENAKTSGIVIVPPGAYSTADGDIMTLVAEMSNTEIYAFGVYNEHGFLTDAEYLSNPNKNNYVLRIINTENISIHGLTIAYDYQALGQAHILEIRDDVEPTLMSTLYGGTKEQYGYEVLIVPSPGFDLDAGWGKSNTDVFSGAYYACSSGGLSPWFSDSYYDYVTTNEDGTIVLRIEQSMCEKLEVGSILCNRMAGDNQQTISVSNAKNILFKDTVVHGYAAALALVMGGESYNVKYERVHNCPTAPAVMTEEEYNFYSSLEDTYSGANFEMYVDDFGRYRGSAPRFCSVDATHVSGSSEGLDIESCLFEQMCDDGSNQHGTSSRLYDIKDNGDGTATIYIKGTVHEVYYGLHSASSNHVRNLTPISFSKGDNIYIYNSKGQLVCDTICLTGSKNESQLSELYYLGVMQYTIHVSSVTVPIEDVNFAALEGYDLKDNHFRMTNKILVDNISHVSGHFTVDNYMIRNSWSRGVLTKTVDVTIKNSTFFNIKSAGVLINSEPNWGESTIPRNITVRDCIIDGTGYTGETWDNPVNAPIYVSALATYDDANIDKLRCENITIDGCEIRNYGHQYGIYVNGAQNVKITNNVFTPKTQSAPGHFIDVTTVANVEISGNKYRDTDGKLSTITGISADDYVNIYGSDVEGQFTHDCDIYIAGTHAAQFKIVPANKENIAIGNILSSDLKKICGYSIASTIMPYANEIKLVASDITSNLIESNAYTVKCTDGQLIITAATNAALIYAVEDFAAYIDGLNQQSVSFDEGYSNSFTFDLTNISATDTNTLKYTGVWNTNGSAMVSGADADYFEFDFTGHSFTLLFNGETAFDISIDDASAIEYNVTDEITFTLSDGEHTVRILCTDDSEPISFLGVKTYSSAITKTADNDKYVMFIGDSMVDYDTSFAHRVGDILGWDYSVVVGNTLPATAVSRVPDTFVLFLGTDAITSSSTSDEIKAFKNTYKSLISSITSAYSSAKVYIMQPLSTSDASDMFNTSHNRYAAINAMKNYSLTGTFDNYSIATNSKVQIIESTNKLTDWGIEFDTSTSTTYPTVNGDHTVTVKLAQYLLNNVGDSDYINATFPIDSMNGYPTTGTNETKEETLTEDGVTFRRFHFVQYGHAWLSGNDSATVPIASAGRYLLLKYRASGEADIRLEIRTNDYGTDAAESGKGYLSGVYKTENNVPEKWEVAIVDLAQFEHYTVGLENTKIQLRISTGSETLDIAFAAILDDLSEAEMAAMFELGATQYRLYEDWSKPGIDVSLNGEEPEKPFDLSFVNQEFSILGMGKYNGNMSLYVNTEEGIDFQRFNFSINESAPTGHVYLLGTNNFVEISGDTGRYFIMKYRSVNDSHISLDALTSDYEWDQQGNNMATQTKPAANIKSGEWEIAVIDMSTFINSSKGTQYTTDADLSVWLRLTTAVSEIDISYMAIVDDLDEANALVKYKGDTSYVHYTNWSKVGTTVTID